MFLLVIILSTSWFVSLEFLIKILFGLICFIHLGTFKLWRIWNKWSTDTPRIRRVAMSDIYTTPTHITTLIMWISQIINGVGVSVSVSVLHIMDRIMEMQWISSSSCFMFWKLWKWKQNQNLKYRLLSDIGFYMRFKIELWSFTFTYIMTQKIMLALNKSPKKTYCFFSSCRHVEEMKIQSFSTSLEYLHILHMTPCLYKD